MQTMGLWRRGKFTHATNGEHDCGAPHVNEYDYEIEIVVQGGRDSLPESKFILDNNVIQRYFVARWSAPGTPSESCELMACDAWVAFLFKLAEQGWRALPYYPYNADHHFVGQLVRLTVRVSGSEKQSWPSASYERPR